MSAKRPRRAVCVRPVEANGGEPRADMVENPQAWARHEHGMSTA
jgi:hypothetical protein